MWKMLGGIVYLGVLSRAIGNRPMSGAYEFLMATTEDFSVVQSLTKTRKRSFR